MRNELLIIINDGLHPFEAILKEIPKSSPFTVKIMEYESLLSPIAPRLLQNALPEEVCIAIQNHLYKSRKNELKAFFSGLFDSPFENFLLIYSDYNQMKEEQNRSLHFLFTENADPSSNAFYLNTTLVSLFSNLKLTRRLNHYIADSFKGVVVSELLSIKNKEIKQLNEELEYKNKIDSLTHLFNRRAIYDFLEKENKRSSRQLWRIEKAKIAHRGLEEYIGMYSIIIIDVDNFKQVNDLYGHIVGDDVLMALGNFILSSGLLRANDLAGRIGGEEFIIILPETDANNAEFPAQRLLDDFKKIPFHSRKNKQFNVTLSAGISQYNKKDKDNNSIIQRADKALYKAKEDGRDRIIIYEKHFDLDNLQF